VIFFLCNLTFLKTQKNCKATFSTISVIYLKRTFRAEGSKLYRYKFPPQMYFSKAYPLIFTAFQSDLALRSYRWFFDFWSIFCTFSSDQMAVKKSLDQKRHASGRCGSTRSFQWWRLDFASLSLSKRYRPKTVKICTFQTLTLNSSKSKTKFKISLSTMRGSAIPESNATNHNSLPSTV